MKRTSPFHRPPGAPRLRIAAAADESETEILLYDEIGFFGVTAKEFALELQAITAKTIHLRINSPGGDVFDGVAIHNAVRAHPARVIVHVDGLAASIASVIALAGDEVRMATNAFFMIHNPWGFTVGDSDAHRHTAGLLDKVADMIVDTYRAKTDEARRQIEEWMRAETWFTAAEAETAGFVDGIDGAAPEDAAAAQFDLSVFSRVPATLAAGAHKPTVRDVERLLRDAGFSRSEAHAMASQGMRALDQRDAGPAFGQELDRLTSILKDCTP